MLTTYTIAAKIKLRASVYFELQYTQPISSSQRDAKTNYKSYAGRRPQLNTHCVTKQPNSVSLQAHNFFRADAQSVSHLAPSVLHFDAQV